jgi:hypothetical protein
MELLVLIVVIMAVASLLVALLTTAQLSQAAFVGLAINAVVGVLMLFLTNLFVSPPIPINIITVLICAIGGVAGWLIILVLYLLQIAFYLDSIVGGSSPG